MLFSRKIRYFTVQKVNQKSWVAVKIIHATPKIRQCRQFFQRHKHMSRTWIFLLAGLMASCAQPDQQGEKEEKRPDPVLISGQVENPAGNVMEVFYYTDFITNNIVSKEVELDGNNVFAFELELDEPRHVHFRIPRRTITLFLRPEADINLVFRCFQR